VASLGEAGMITVPIDISALREAGDLLYGGALVAARAAAVGRFVAEHYDDCDPVVRDIITRAGQPTAAQLAGDQVRVKELALVARTIFRSVDALCLPTTPGHPTFQDVHNDPVGVNSWLGCYTNFCNVLDLSAVAVPGGTADGGPFGVTLFAPAFHDGVLGDLARRLAGGEPGVVANRPDTSPSGGRHACRRGDRSD
jgi:allophanate hydrolase